MIYCNSFKFFLHESNEEQSVFFHNDIKKLKLNHVMITLSIFFKIL